MATSEDMADPDTDSRERLGEALDSVAPLLAQSIRALAAPPVYSPFAQARTCGMRLYGCCEHCDHDINDAPHDIPCPEGCTDDDE